MVFRWHCRADGPMQIKGIVLLNNRFLEWCSFSLAGHLVLFELLIAAPLFVAFSIALGYAHAMTPQRAFYLALACVLAGAAVGLVTWFAITRPLIRRRP